MCDPAILLERNLIRQWHLKKIKLLKREMVEKYKMPNIMKRITKKSFESCVKSPLNILYERVFICSDAFFSFLNSGENVYR